MADVFVSHTSSDRDGRSGSQRSWRRLAGYRASTNGKSRAVKTYMPGWSGATTLLTEYSAFSRTTI
jgi:hypothetical protein